MHPGGILCKRIKYSNWLRKFWDQRVSIQGGLRWSSPHQSKNEEKSSSIRIPSIKYLHPPHKSLTTP